MNGGGGLQFHGKCLRLSVILPLNEGYSYRIGLTVGHIFPDDLLLCQFSYVKHDELCLTKWSNNVGAFQPSYPTIG